MLNCLFSADLHGHVDRYQKLFAAIMHEHPYAVFLGGDLLPSPLLQISQCDFIEKFLVPEFARLAALFRQDYPRVFVILGNDDSRAQEGAMLKAASDGVWEYIHNRKVKLGDFSVYGYTYVPPTPFVCKDWERYDIGQFVDPGCISPEQGKRSVCVSPDKVRYSTIAKDLKHLVGVDELEQAIFLFHAPPYQTKLDRANLDNKLIDHAPIDVHVGSIAIKRFIESREPLITLHGHVHESARLSGSWKEYIGRTCMFSAAHDGDELALVRFDAKEPRLATRELI